jgi:4-hydroxythreonine-4-phosphate dehydrogenase
VPRIVLTTGEPAGIGPDISLSLAAEPVQAVLLALGDPDLLAERARLLGTAIRIKPVDSPEAATLHSPGTLMVLPVPTAVPVTPGRLDTANAAYVVETLATAARLCLSGAADAVVTAPVQKSVIHRAGIPFSGHTEFFAAATGADLPVMMLVARHLRVALATTHLPLRDVADAIDAVRLEKLLRTVDAELRLKLGIAEPRILVLGLNPHAGEAGVLGDEEITTITPVVERLAAEGLGVIGPVPADTAFTSESLARADVVVAMYHDQGLPVIKAVGFGEIVNVTLGLPIIRTSVDHGTALDLAGTGRARHQSLAAAVALALELAATAGAA